METFLDEYQSCACVSHPWDSPPYLESEGLKKVQQWEESWDEMAEKFRGRTEAVSSLGLQISKVTADFKVCILDTYYRVHEKYSHCSSN